MSNKTTSKKKKVTIAAAIAASAGIVAPVLVPMSSCATTKIENDTTDKEYGVSEETYNDLKQSFRNEYKQKLEDLGYTGQELQKRLDSLEQDIKNFDDAEKSNNYSYTVLTNGLIEFARTQDQRYPVGDNTKTEPYNIRLERKHTRAKWSDLNDLYDGMADSFRTYMHNNRMPASTIKRILADANTKFKTLKAELQGIYGNDALAGLLKAKEKVITFFDVVNDEVALVSATLRLKDFMSEFTFDYRDYDENGNYYNENRLDILKGNPDFQEGKILTNDLMNKIFTITRKSTGDTVEFDANTIVPGYTLQPKLTNIFENDFANLHSISIDFGLVKNSYAQKYANDPEKLANVTGHLFETDSGNDNILSLNDGSSMADVLKSLRVRTITYNVRLTAKEEAIRLEQTYFNKDSENGSISFKWDMKNQAYEAFFDNAIQNDDGSWNASLTNESLINAGLLVSDGKSSFVPFGKDLRKDELCTSLLSQFVRLCVVTSNAIITETEHKDVTHDFKVKYANSIYDDNANLYDVKEDQDLKLCRDFSVSKRFFQNVNDKFNQTAQKTLCLDNTLKNLNGKANGDDDDTSFGLLGLQAAASMVLRSLALLAYGVALTKQLASFIQPYKDGKSKILIGLAILLNCAIAALQGYDYALFVKNYFKPAIEFCDNAKNARSAVSQSNLMKMLKKDLQENFVLYNDDGTYDQNIFNQQLAKFNKKSMSEMLGLYRKYSTINDYTKNISKNTEAQNAMMEFDNILVQNKASKNDYKKTFDDWSFGTGKLWWHTFGLTFVTCLLNIVLTYVIHKLMDKIASGEFAGSSDSSVDSHGTSMTKQEINQVFENKIRRNFVKSCTLKNSDLLDFEEYGYGAETIIGWMIGRQNDVYYRTIQEMRGQFTEKEMKHVPKEKDFFEKLFLKKEYTGDESIAWERYRAASGDFDAGNIVQSVMNFLFGSK